MADTKLSDLTANTSPASTDILYFVKSATSYQATLGNISKGIVVTSLDVTGLTASELLRLNSGGTALESAGATVAQLATVANPTFTGTVTLPTGLTGVIRADSGVVSIDSDVTDVVSAASTTVAGKVEIAIASEIDTGTDATRAVSPDGLQDSFRNLRFMLFDLTASDASVVTDTTIGGDWPVPFSGTIIQDDNNLDYFAAYTDTAGTTGTMVVDVHLNGTTIMTTNKLDIETTEKDTTTAATQPDLTTTAVTAGDILTFDIDAVHSGTAAKGLKIMIAIRPD